MATIVYQFAYEINMKTKLCLERGLILMLKNQILVEEDSTVLEDIFPAVYYKDVMLDFEARRFLSIPDLFIFYHRYTLVWEET